MKNEVRPIDKSKPSNHRCINCEAWDKATALPVRCWDDPITLDQLRKMDGWPAYCGDRKEWGVIHIDPDSPWANVPFFRGVYCDLDVKHNGLTLYAYQPAHIDQEEWEPCGLCKSCGNCAEAGKASGEKINYAHPCHSCLNGDNFKPVGFCRYCGRLLTEEAWAELEKRMGV